MKKTLHGRRHLRARKSAEHGRAQLRRKRELRNAYELGVAISKLPELFTDAASQFIEVVKAFTRAANDTGNIRAYRD